LTCINYLAFDIDRIAAPAEHLFFVGLCNQNLEWRETMTEEIPGSEGTERVPVLQKMLDNPFLLLFIGVVFPTVFYIIWGIMELVGIPVAK
jgi:hypothetical protein